MLYLGKPSIKTLYPSLCPPACAASPPAFHHMSPSPQHSPMRRQKEVSTQHARCWIGCYFSHPTGPNSARGWGLGAPGTGHAGLGGGRIFLCFICLQLGHQEREMGF